MSHRALIFDVDGTLAETEELHRRAFNDAFCAAGLDWHWDADLYGDLLRVTGGKERMAHYATSAGEAVPDPVAIARLHRAKTDRFTELLAGGALSPRPGIPDLLARARDAKLRLAIATTTSRANVDALVPALFGHSAAELFEVIAAGDEVARKKPAPDVYLLALERLGLPAAACLAFEDSRNGVAAARAAGLAVIAAPARYTAGDDLSAADIFLPCFSEAPAHVFAEVA